MKVGDRVKVKSMNQFSGTSDITAFLCVNNTPDEVYEVEHITPTGDVYVKGRVNYFRQSSLEVVI